MVAAPHSSTPPPPSDPRFPGLRPEVIAGYLAAPDTMVAEVIDGELFVMPRPRPRHSHAASRFLGRLRGFHDPMGDDPGGWVILVEPELHLGSKPDILVPDLAGWHRDRFPENALDEGAPAAITVAPDWVCEVLSDSTAALDRGRKRRIYRRESVRHYWICDPRDRTVEVNRLENGRWLEVETYEGDAVVRAEPFDAIEIDLGALWRI